MLRLFDGRPLQLRFLLKVNLLAYEPRLIAPGLHRLHSIEGLGDPQIAGDAISTLLGYRSLEIQNIVGIRLIQS